MIQLRQSNISPRAERRGQTLKSSTISTTKRCQNYVKKLDKQIQTISDEVMYFNGRQNNRPSTKNETRYNLKKLSQPKYQHILLTKQLNPEYPKVQPTSKINKLFRNCSTISQNNFGYLNNSFLNGGTESLLMESSVKKLSETQKKINKKVRVLEKCWDQVQEFRLTYDLSQGPPVVKNNKRTQVILQRVQKKRPLTTGTGRAKLTQSNIWGVQFKSQI